MEDPIQIEASTELPKILADSIANPTNATSKFVPTPEGMACAYISIMIMALIPIFVGSFKSVKYQVKTQARCIETGEQAETMTVKDAAIFPIIASCALFGFYILIKLSPDLVNLAISGYFFLLGVLAIFRLIQPALKKIFPRKYNSTQYVFLFGSSEVDQQQSSQQQQQEEQQNSEKDGRSGTTSPTGSNDSVQSNSMVPSEVMVCNKFTHSDILAFILAGALGVWYILTKHWVANNAFGLAFALNGIELLPVNTVGVGCILLCGLFVYDVFWVFGTNVMVSVAKNFDAPIKIIFPQDFLISGFWGKNFAMLGLGDIVIPGIYIAFLLRFDHSLKRKTNIYFWSCFLAYIFGLALTIGVMSYFKHAQPALLYLVPCCVIIPFLIAAFKGDLKAMFNYCDHPQQIEDKVESKKDKKVSDDESDEGTGADEEQENKEGRRVNTRSSSKKSK